MLGWRLWRLRPEGLRSWAAWCYWEPGANSAGCLSSNPCPRSPGSGCRCGFWALFSPTRCLEHARQDSGEQKTALGLVQAWGEVALHGEEGFRTGNAAVVALFTDWVWDIEIQPRSRVRSWWWRLLHAGDGASSRRTPPDPDREQLLTTMARMYAVPLLPLAEALHSGFLGEVGVDAAHREEVRRLVERPAPSGGVSSGPRAGRDGMGDAA